MLLKKRLGEIMRNAVFFGEETGEDPRAVEYVFIVDQIDGTTNFVHNIGINSVSIALLKNGIPEIGVVYYLYLNRMFEAKAGNGAYLNSKRINVSDRTDENSILGIAMIVYNVLSTIRKAKKKKSHCRAATPQ